MTASLSSSISDFVAQAGSLPAAAREQSVSQTDRALTILTGKIALDQGFKIRHTTQPIVLLVIFIWALTIISQLASLAYSTSNSENSFQSVVFQSIIFLSIVTLPLGALGIWLGQKIDLGAPLLSAIIRNQPDTIKIKLKDLRITIIQSLLLGGTLLILRIFTKQYLPPELPAFGHRGILGGLLVSAGAAVGEEVWFRLGLMTIILWVVTRILGETKIRPFAAWTTIILVAIIFGAVHLPQLMSYGAGSSFAIWGTLIGNSVAGILYGWCYWRKGLIAAITAHFCVDLVIHVFPAFFV